MNIAIDVTPIEDPSKLSHRVRGTGVYIQSLKSSLVRYFPENKYTFFTRGQSLSKSLDLVHIPYFEPFFLMLPFRKKFKTVVTVHDLTPLVFARDFPAGIKGGIKWRIQKAILKRTDGIITDSESSKKDIVKFTGIREEKIHVVYLAAAERFKRIENSGLRIQNLRKKYALPDRFALYVGDGTWNKNLPGLIEACLMEDIPLVMAGKALAEEKFDRKNPWNFDLAKVQDMAKKSKNIILTGFVPDEDLTALYNMASVFVMPSFYEGFGLPILEAMSCGVPVVTSKEGSIPEVAGEAAFFVDPRKPEDIARGIKKVFTDKKLQRELSEKGLLQAQKFSWQKTAQQTVKVYEEITKN